MNDSSPGLNPGGFHKIIFSMCVILKKTNLHATLFRNFNGNFLWKGLQYAEK